MGWDDSDEEDDWEAKGDDVALPAAGGPKRQVWSDEEDDSEEEEEEEEPQPETTGAAMSEHTGVKAEKVVKQKHLKKKMLKEKEEKERVAKMQEEEDDDEDAIERKLRLQRLVEQADFENAEDVFGLGASTDPVLPADFMALGKVVGAKLKEYEGGAFYVQLLKAFMKEACADLKSDDMKELNAQLTNVHKAKALAQSKADGKGKTKKGKVLKVEGGDYNDDGW